MGEMSVDAWRLEMVGGSNNKFYEVFVLDCRVLSHWGRIGTKGQVSSSTWPNHREAQVHGVKMAHAKKIKGYTEVSHARFMANADLALEPDKTLAPMLARIASSCGPQSLRNDHTVPHNHGGVTASGGTHDSGGVADLAPADGVKSTREVADALATYDHLADRVKSMMDLASSDLGATMEEYEQLAAVWEKVSNKHEEVATAMSTAKVTLMKKLMFGS